MKRSIEALFFAYKRAHSRKKRWHWIAVSLSAVVVLGTGYALSMPAATLHSTVYCDVEEHEHTEECYARTLACLDVGHKHDESCYIREKVLVCSLEESEEHSHTEARYSEEAVCVCELEKCEGHVHSEDCYLADYDTLTCDIPAHTHTLQCYSNPEADLETSAEWEGVFKRASLTGYWRDDVCAVARTQLGYQESAQNYLVADDGITVSGYTRYGQWFGEPYAEWSSLFCDFCLYYAGVDAALLSQSSSCAEWVEALNAPDCDRYRLQGTYIPSAGDLVFFDLHPETDEAEPTADHVGFVLETEFDEKTGNLTKIHTIEGNAGKCVCQNTYLSGDSRILGFGVLPENSPTTGKNVFSLSARTEIGLEVSISGENSVLPCAPDEVLLHAQSVEDARADVLLARAIPAPDAEEFCCDEADEADPSIDFVPDAVVLSASASVSDEEHEDFPCDGEEFIECASEEPDTEITECEAPYEVQTFLLDINLLRQDAETGETSEIAPADTVMLTISGIPSGSFTSVQVFRLDMETDTAEPIEASINSDGNIELETDRFSRLGVVLTATPSGTAINSASNFYNKVQQSGTYYLSNDITVTNKVTISSGSVTLDLNGHRITANSGNPVFEVTGGSLTILDSKTPTVNSQVVTGTSLWANTASYSSGTLTYYVTETQPVGTPTGDTYETLRRYTVSGAGMIVRGTGSNTRAIVQSGGTLNLDGGYICNFKSDNGGAVYVTGGTLNLRGTVIAANTATDRGGGVYLSSDNRQATMNISGGMISGNTAQGEGGGAICATRSAVVNMSGGYLTNNEASGDGYSRGGGGIFLQEKGVLYLSGGYITGNRAQGGGGGIKTAPDWGSNPSTSDRPTGGAVYFTGGYVSANNCYGAEGGGINVSAGGFMTIIPDQNSSIYISNNSIRSGIHDETFGDWGGGGIFCAENSVTVYIENAVIAHNGAGGFGGGVAGCSTGRIVSSDSNGVAIYDNSALGEHISGSGSTKNEDHAYAMESPVFMENGYQDYFCALTSAISGGMLGGGTANWQGSADGVPVSSNDVNDVLIAASIMGLTAHPTDESKQAAQAMAKVYITGNESPTHGGGILANGYLVLGASDQITSYARLELSAMKKYYDENGGSIAPPEGAFSFIMVDSDGFEVARGVADSSGDIVFDRRLPFTSAGEYVYLLYEIPPDAEEYPNVQWDTREYRLTITVVARGNGQIPWIDIDRVVCEFSNVTITEIDGSAETVIYNQNPGNDEAHSVHLAPTNNQPFENRIVEVQDFSVRVNKVWAGSSQSRPNVTMTLFDNGTSVGTAVLNSANHWSYTWSGLDSQHSYSVSETPVTGYSPSYATSYENTTSQQSAGTNEAKLYVKNGSYFIPASSISVGSEYLISNPDRTKILYTTDAHADSSFTSADAYSVTPGSGSVTVGGRSYSDYFAAANIPERGIFVAQSASSNNNPRTVLKNKAIDSWLLAEPINDSYFKGTTGIDWSSGLRISSGHLQVQQKWENAPYRYVIWTGSQFESAESLGNIMITTVTGSTKVVTVTNTPIQNVEFSLDVLKTAVGDASHVLGGAEFQLLRNSSPLHFSLSANGVYRYADTGSETLLVSQSNGHILIAGLPAGTYTLTEIRPPTGYRTADPVSVTLDETVTERTLTITVEDSELIYELPETGKRGSEPFWYCGIGVLSITAFYLLEKRRRERRNRPSS